MTRITLALGSALLIAGCFQDAAPPAKTETPAKSAPAAAKPAKLYFELNKDGKTYVFGNVATMQKVTRGEPANVVTKEKFGPAGETVAFETDGAGLETRLMEEYGKQHPKK